MPTVAAPIYTPSSYPMNDQSEPETETETETLRLPPDVL
jgi:hypothetical protein